MRIEMVCLFSDTCLLSPRQQRQKIQKSKNPSSQQAHRNATMSDDQETKPTETPKVEEEEPKKEEDDKVKEEESTATFEPVVSKIS